MQMVLQTRWPEWKRHWARQTRVCIVPWIRVTVRKGVGLVVFQEMRA